MDTYSSVMIAGGGSVSGMNGNRIKRNKNALPIVLNYPCLISWSLNRN